MKKAKLIIVGFGSRGQLFGGYALDHENTELVAIADVNPEARAKAIKEFGIKPENCFKSADEIFSHGKIADAAFICTQDKQHKEHAITAMRLGYDICLEKPIAATMEDCEEILRVQEETGKKAMILPRSSLQPVLYEDPRSDKKRRNRRRGDDQPGRKTWRTGTTLIPTCAGHGGTKRKVRR